MEFHMTLVFKSSGLPRPPSLSRPRPRPRISACTPALPPIAARRPGLVSSEPVRSLRKGRRRRRRESILGLTDRRLFPWNALRVKKALRMLLDETASCAPAERDVNQELSQSCSHTSEIKKETKYLPENVTKVPLYQFPSISPPKANIPSSKKLQSSHNRKQTQETKILGGRRRKSQVDNQKEMMERLVKVCKEAFKKSEAKGNKNRRNTKHAVRKKRCNVDSLPKREVATQVEEAAQSKSQVKPDGGETTKYNERTKTDGNETNASKVETKERMNNEETKVTDNTEIKKREDVTPDKPETEVKVDRARGKGKHRRMNGTETIVNQIIYDNWDNYMEPTYDAEMSLGSDAQIKNSTLRFEKVKPKTAHYETSLNEIFKNTNIKKEENSPVIQAMARMESKLSEIMAIRKIEIKPKLKEFSTLEPDSTNQNTTSELEPQGKEIVPNDLKNQTDAIFPTRAREEMRIQKINERIFKVEKLKKEILEIEERVLNYVSDVDDIKDEKSETVETPVEQSKLSRDKEKAIYVNKFKWNGREKAMFKSQLNNKGVNKYERDRSSDSTRKDSKRYGIIGVRSNKKIIKLIGSKKDGFEVKRMRKSRAKAESKIQSEMEEEKHIKAIMNLIKRTNDKKNKQLLAKKKTEGRKRESEILLNGSEKIVPNAYTKNKEELHKQAQEKNESMTSEVKQEKTKPIVRRTFRIKNEVKESDNAKLNADINICMRSNAHVESNPKFKSGGKKKIRTKVECEVKNKWKEEVKRRDYDEAMKEKNRRAAGRARTKDVCTRGRQVSNLVAADKGKEVIETKLEAENEANGNVGKEYQIQSEKPEAREKNEEHDIQEKNKDKSDVIAGNTIILESNSNVNQEMETRTTTQEENGDKLKSQIAVDATLNHEMAAGSEPNARGESEHLTKDKIETEAAVKVAPTEIKSVSRAVEDVEGNGTEEIKTESEHTAKIKMRNTTKVRTLFNAMLKMRGEAPEKLKSKEFANLKPIIGAKCATEEGDGCKRKVDGEEKTKERREDSDDGAVESSKRSTPESAAALCDAPEHCPLHLSHWKFAKLNCPTLKTIKKDSTQTSRMPSIGESGEATDGKAIPGYIPSTTSASRRQATRSVAHKSQATQTSTPASTQTVTAVSASTQTGASTLTSTSLPSLLSMLSRMMFPSMTVMPVTHIATPMPTSSVQTRLRIGRTPMFPVRRSPCLWMRPKSKSASTSTVITVPISRHFALDQEMTSSTQTDPSVPRRKWDEVRTATAATTTAKTATPSVKKCSWGS